MVVDDAGLRALLERIALTARARTETEALLRDAVADARAAGCTWESIGQGLGLTGQAAERAYRHGVPTPPPGDPTTGRVLKLAPLYPFNEMNVLESAGRYGWHAVGSGSAMHLMQQDDVQWEHRRVFASRARGRSLESEGWQQWTPGWFPWAYYNRPTDRPAEPEPPGLDLMRP